MSFRKYLAELVGTFGLTLAVSLSLVLGLPLATPLVAGLTLGLFVYTVGNVSGAHLNPAVTIGLASVKKIEPKEAVMYIIVQVVGALLAMLTTQWMTGDVPDLLVENSFAVGGAEALGAFFLVFGVSSVVFGKVKEAASGLTIGGSLLLGIMMTGGLSNGVLNPAVAIGIGSVSLMYLIGPVVGGLAAALLYEYIGKE